MKFHRLISLLAPLLGHVQALTYRGADISAVPLLESQGKKFKDTDGVVRPFETIMTRHGANTARVRVWTAGQYSLTYALALGKRIKAAGMTLIVDLHYSDTWADPGHQSIPSGWPTDVSGLNTKIYTYTQSVVQAFVNQGTTIDILQVGNEIINGLLFPTGQIGSQGFSPASQFLHSAVSGARSVASPKIMVHLAVANGWSSGDLTWFWGGIFIQGAFATTDIDIMGFSFYPFYGTAATFANLKSQLTAIVNKYGKDVMVAETDWPATCSGTTLSEPSVPVSAAGQNTWVSKIRDTLAALPGSHGKGILYWEPEWIGNAGLGSSCADNLIVNSDGSSRASIDIFNNM